MDLHTVAEIHRPATRAALPTPRDGDAFLAGGTWLFSEPQPALRRLIDLLALPWDALHATGAGLHIPATCTLAALEAFPTPPGWPGAAIIAPCCQALLGSFKIAAVATVGGNLCLALPAAPMAALAVALAGTCTIWQPDGGQRSLPAAALITGPQTTSLRPGEILRAIHLPAAALRRRAALRQISLTALGRSAALLIASTDGADFQLTITAATPRPVQLAFAAMPAPAALAAAIDEAVPDWLDDVHGSPLWRRRITHVLAQELAAAWRA
jgi:CO/xanthine dehydrogenase FAD-binding subunit